MRFKKVIQLLGVNKAYFTSNTYPTKNTITNLLVEYEIEVKKTCLPLHLSFTTRKAKNSFRYKLPHNSNKFFPKIIDPYFTIKTRSKKRKKQDLKEAILWKLKEIKNNRNYDIWYPPAGFARGIINVKTVIKPANFISIDIVLNPGFTDTKVIETKDNQNDIDSKTDAIAGAVFSCFSSEEKNVESFTKKEGLK